MGIELKNGDWKIGDWGLRSNPQSPNTNPHLFFINLNFYNFFVFTTNLNWTHYNTIHETTQFKRFEVFYTTSEDIKEKVCFNALNSFKKVNVDASIFTSTEKVLLYNNFIIESKNKKEGKKYLLKNKVKKDKLLYNICASIITNRENGTYEILIERDYHRYNLNKYDICIVGPDLLKGVKESIWDSIFNS